MLIYVVRRLVQAVPAIFLATIAVFLLVHLLPGDTAVAVAGPEASLERITQIRRDFGLDQPLPVQYSVWLGRVVRGDLGVSNLSGLPVITLIGQRAGATLELAVAAMFLTVVLSLTLGIVAAVRPGGIIDTSIRFVNVLALSIPGFWLGILLILLFALALGWLPPGGRADPLRDPVDGLRTLILPAFTLALRSSAGVARLVRSSMLEILGEDYVRTAHAKGQRPRWVIISHALPNALLPVVTVLGIQFGQLLGGAVITESVFAWPGVGQLIIDSIVSRDYAVIQATLLLFVVVFVFVNILTDMLYSVFDPRVRA